MPNSNEPKRTRVTLIKTLLIDSFGRTIDYLRVSLTDRCNFRCVYCMPEEGCSFTPKEECLTGDETLRLIRIAASLGISKIRLTGGEPLLRKDLPWLIHHIAQIPTITDISCTTNGFLLAEQATFLAGAGLTRVNVSLDTLRHDRFVDIARRGSLDKVLKGIQAALEHCLDPVKINCVLMKNENDDEVCDFAKWTLNENIHVRFIELMPMLWNLDEAPALDRDLGDQLIQIRQSSGSMLDDNQMRRRFFSAREARGRIEAAFSALEPAEVRTNGPSRTFRIPGAVGTVGFISQITEDFCVGCNRLRLTHDGFLRPCLMSDGEIDLATQMRMRKSDSELAALFELAVLHKPERHYLAEGQKVTGRGMSQLGG